VRHTFLFFIFQYILIQISSAQTVEQKIATQYMSNAEYEKAMPLLEKILPESNDINTYQQLLKCYTMLRQYEDALKLAQKFSKKNKNTLAYRVDIGYVYELKKDTAKAQKEFENAIKDLDPIDAMIQDLANGFDNYAKKYWVAKTYEKGAKLLKDDNIYVFELAKAYIAIQENKLAVQAYLKYLERNPQQIQVVKNTFQSLLDNKKINNELSSQVYSYLQKEPDNNTWNDFAVWIAIQNRDFEDAIDQVIAIDKRKNENGVKVMDIARMARQEKDFTSALRGYNYILSKGKSVSNYYSMAENEILSTRKEKLENTVEWAQEDALALKEDYNRFFRDYGKNSATASLIVEYADVLSKYTYELDTAILELESLINMGNLSNDVKNRAKLKLGDFYVMIDEVWEAMLLYGQIGKDEKDSPLGEEARYKHAKLFYHKGEFELAREMLNVLKTATSELIANDALNLSVFILENMGTDSIYEPVMMYADVELLIVQNKLDKALFGLDSLYNAYKGHPLTDDIYFTKAKIFLKKRDYSNAVAQLQMIITNFKNDLLGDDAMYLIAQIYEENLKNPEKAKEYYKELIITYKDSVHLVEARKKYRKLRGDKLDEEL
jgi:tetratricopeptide (TPR) repeat protein